MEKIENFHRLVSLHPWKKVLSWIRMNNQWVKRRRKCDSILFNLYLNVNGNRSIADFFWFWSKVNVSRFMGGLRFHSQFTGQLTFLSPFFHSLVWKLSYLFTIFSWSSLAGWFFTGSSVLFPAQTDWQYNKNFHFYMYIGWFYEHFPTYDDMSRFVINIKDSWREFEYFFSGNLQQATPSRPTIDNHL